MATKEKKSRGWLSLVYPSEAYVRVNYPDCQYDGRDGWGKSPADWFQILAGCGVQALISPLHYKDINPDADEHEKKPHYHIILLWDGPTTYSNAKAYLSLINGVGCKPMASLRGASRYLCHMDNPEKYQYDKSGVRQLGGLDYDEIINSVSDTMLTVFEIMDFIDREKMTSYWDLMRFCRAFRPDWAKVLLCGQRENVYKYQRSLEYRLEKVARDQEQSIRPSVSPDLRKRLEIENARKLLESAGYSVGGAVND